MPKFDSHSKVKQLSAISLQAITSNRTIIGNIINTLGFDSLEFVVHAGTITDGTYTLSIYQSDNADFSDSILVTDALTLGDRLSFTATDDNAAIRVGTIGKMQFQRLHVISSGVSSGVPFFGAVALLGNPDTSPVSED